MVETRKIQLEELEKCMRKSAQKDVDSMNEEEIVDRMIMLNERKLDWEDERRMRDRLNVMERTRHLIVWHDLPTVANHSHFVFMATCICPYDQATFYTNSEYKSITAKLVNIQSIVETPRSSTHDEDQLCYVETRLECFEELSDPT